MFNNFTETELANEQWRDVDGYDGMYQVSDLGRVRSRKSGEWKVLRASKNNSGYLLVSLCKDGKEKTISVHRLVASAFITNNDDAKNEINHRDECKQNNRVSNLEYCDRSYNLTYNGIQQRRTANRNTPQHYNSKRRKIEKLYNPDLSYNENLKVFKENGVECSKNVIFKLRKDLGLIKTD